MKTSLFIAILFLLHTACDQKPIVLEVSKLDISSELLLQVKRANPTDSLERELERLPKEWFINEPVSYTHLEHPKMSLIE